MKILSFGEIIWDIFATLPHIGGAPLNLAAHAAMQWADSWIISCVGNDELGKKALIETEKLGVKTDYISVCDKPTGQCIVTLDDKGVPQYDLIRDAAYDYIPAPEFNEKHFDVLAFGTLALRENYNISQLKKIISEKRHSETFCDVNIRKPFYSKESIMFCLQNATILKISDEELPVITQTVFNRSLTPEAAALSLAERFGCLKIIIITKGENGSYVYGCKEKMSYSCGAVKVNVVSTVGAGDSFSATFLTQYFKTGDIKKSLDAAARVSAFVVSVKEAVPNYNPKALQLGTTVL